MARGKVAQGARAPKMGAEQPVSEGIRRAAQRAGIVDHGTSLVNLMVFTGEPIFDGNEAIRPEATIADLVSAMFSAPNSKGAGLLADLLLCTADELSLICAAQDSPNNLSDVVGRVTMRAEWRVRIMLELERRMRAAAAGGAS